MPIDFKWIIASFKLLTLAIGMLKTDPAFEYRTWGESGAQDWSV